MGLKLKLRPGERVFINGSLIRNGDSGAELELLNRVPLLREKDILLEAEVDTPCKRLYLMVQTMYFDSMNTPGFLATFESLADEVAKAAPSTVTRLNLLRKLVSEQKYYEALKALRQLIEYEKELIQHAKQPQ